MELVNGGLYSGAKDLEFVEWDVSPCTEITKGKGVAMGGEDRTSSAGENKPSSAFRAWAWAWA